MPSPLKLVMSRPRRVLPPLPAAVKKPNRLDLARWLVDPGNPLPPRVTINRAWYYIFGTGIVETTEDFGVMGAKPSHPKLLEWLAGEFVASDWDYRHMIKLMVTSATYRQNSRVTPDLYARDPLNRLLARGPRFRVEGEVVHHVAAERGELDAVAGLGQDRFFAHARTLTASPSSASSARSTEECRQVKIGVSDSV